MLGFMTTAFVALGSNLGKRQTALRAAIDRIGRMPGTRVIAVADFLENPAVDAPPDSPAFLNSVMQILTSASAEELLAQLLEIERELGRDRDSQPANAPRTIDLDLLLFGDLILNSRSLIVPHPRMHVRRFVLQPLVQIAPDVVHPISGKTARELLAELAEPSSLVPGRLS